MRFIPVLTLLLVGFLANPSQAIQDSLLNSRITLRRSTFCASLLTATKALAGTADAGILQSTFRDFRSKTLGCPIFQDEIATGPICANSGKAANESLALVAARAHLVETSFGQSSSADSKVIARAQVSGSETIEQFVSLLATSQDTILSMADDPSRLEGFPDFFRFLKHKMMYTYGLIFAWTGAKIGVLSSALFTGILLSGKNPFNHPGEILGVAIFSGFIALGAIDYPIRVWQTYENGKEKLSAALRRFLKSNDTWMYWSRDLRVSRGFVIDLLAMKQVRWYPTLHEENVFEEIPGLWRYSYLGDSQDPRHEWIDFAVDVLTERDADGEVKMSLVLRSQPLQSKAEIVVPVAAPNLVPASSSP